MVTTFGVAAAVFGVLAAVELTIRGGWPTALLTVLLGVTGAVIVVAALAVGLLALVFTAEFVHRHRARRRVVLPAIHSYVPPPPCTPRCGACQEADAEALARALGMTDWERP